MRGMNYKSDIFPPGPRLIFPPGRPAGDHLGGTSPSGEGDFHGKPEHLSQPNAPDASVPHGQGQILGDSWSITRIGFARSHCWRMFPGALPTGRYDALKSQDRKRPVDYEHRPLGPPGGGRRQPLRSDPFTWIGPAPPGGFRSCRRGPPGASPYKFNSLSAGRWRDSALVTQPETHGKDAVMNNTNQGR